MNRYTIVLLCALALLPGCGRKEKRADKKTTPVVVKVLPAHAADSEVSTCFVGSVSSSRTATVNIPVSGTLVALDVKDGERVSEGQVLARVESQIVRSAYESAKSELDRAEDGWARIQEVYKDGSVTEVEYVKVRTQVEESRATEKAARKRLEDCTIKAPFDGYIEKTLLTEGVEVTVAEQLLRILDLDALEVHFPLPENEFSHYAEGVSARVEIPALDRSVDGTLKTKGVVASSMSHSYDCTVALRGSTRGLMPGMVCKVYLRTGGISGSTVPAVAVKTDMDGRYVWVVNEGVVCKRYVTVGGFGNDGIILSGGLEDQDLVIVEGARKVSVGMQVQTVE